MGTPVVTVDGLAQTAALVLADADYNAVGTGDNVPDTTDTQLAEETNRSAVSQRLRTGAVIQVRTLHGNGNLPTTSEELGLYLNASSSPNNGELLARVLEEFTKSNSDLLVVWEITFSGG